MGALYSNRLYLSLPLTGIGGGSCGIKYKVPLAVSALRIHYDTLEYRIWLYASSASQYRYSLLRARLRDIPDKQKSPRFSIRRTAASCGANPTRASRQSRAGGRAVDDDSRANLKVSGPRLKLSAM